MVELPGVANPERVRKLLQGTAKLEFWETYDNSEVYSVLDEINQKLTEVLDLQESTNEAEAEIEEATQPEEGSLLEDLQSTDSDSTTVDGLADMQNQYPLYMVLTPSISANGQLLFRTSCRYCSL